MSSLLKLMCVLLTVHGALAAATGSAEPNEPADKCTAQVSANPNNASFVRNLGVEGGCQNPAFALDAIPNLDGTTVVAIVPFTECNSSGVLPRTFSFLALDSTGDTVLWQRNLRHPSQDQIESFRSSAAESVVASQDALYIGGTVQLGTEFVARHVAGLVKASQDGEILWQRQIVNSDNSLQSDLLALAPTDDGGVIAAIDINASSETFRDIGVVKVSSDGNLVWFAMFSNPNQRSHHAASLDITSDGSILAAFTTSERGVSRFYVQIIRLTSAGSFEFARELTKQSPTRPSIVALSDGQFAVTYDVTTASGGDGQAIDGFNPNGTRKWKRVFRSQPSKPLSLRVAEEPNGDYLMIATQRDGWVRLVPVSASGALGESQDFPAGIGAVSGFQYGVASAQSNPSGDVVVTSGSASFSSAGRHAGVVRISGLAPGVDSNCEPSSPMNPFNEVSHDSAVAISPFTEQAVAVSVEPLEMNQVDDLDFSVNPTCPPPPDSVFEVTPADLEFGPIEIGSCAQREFTLTNTGNDSGSIVKGITVESPFFLASDGCSPFAIPPGASCMVEVELCPEQSTESSDVIEINTTSNTTPLVEVELSGRGTEVLRTLSVTIEGVGVVSGTPSGLVCSENQCSGEFADGDAVELSAAPGVTSEFLGWDGDCLGSGACELVMDGDKFVVASFRSMEPPIFDDGFECQSPQ